MKLKCFCTRITKGTTPKRGFVSNGVNYIKSESLNYDGNINTEKFSKIDQGAHLIELKRSILLENDILFSIAGANLAKCGIIKKEYLPANTNQANAIITVNPLVAIPLYIYYSINNSRMVKKVFNSISQSAQPNFNLSDLGNTEINIPSLEEQQKIVDILSPIDEKIELNNKINKTLEEMAQLLYKQWFIDFEFPNDEGNPFKSAGGKMIYNEELDKEIPEGWKVNKLEKYININTGSLNSEQSEANGIYPFYTRNVITSSINRYTHDTEGVIVAGEGNFLPKYARGKFALHQRTYLLNSKSKLKNELLYFIIKNNVNLILQTSVGSTVRSLRKATFENILVVFPENLENIEDKIYLNYLDNMINILNENRLLENQKKILLDKYFGGSNE